MFRFSHRSYGGKAYPTFAGFLAVVNKHDAPNSPTAEKWKKEIEYEAGLTGWDRLKEMYKFDETGPGMELISCIQLSTVAGLVGFVIGGVDKSKFAVADFKERNQAALYRNTFEAQRSLRDYVTKQFFKGGFPMGVKMSSFLLCYSLACTTVSCYRDRTSVTDFTIGGGLTGAIFTCHRGLAGAISGGLLGMALGTITGLVTMGVLKLYGNDLKDVRMWQYEQARKRKNLEHQGWLKEREHHEDGNERLAFLVMTDEEKKQGRIVDRLDAVETVAPVVQVIVPELPPESMIKAELKAKR